MFVGRAEGSCGLMHAHLCVWGNAQLQGMRCLADSSGVCVTGLANGLSGNTSGAFNMVRFTAPEAVRPPQTACATRAIWRVLHICLYKEADLSLFLFCIAAVMPLIHTRC